TSPFMAPLLRPWRAKQLSLKLYQTMVVLSRSPRGPCVSMTVLQAAPALQQDLSFRAPRQKSHRRPSGYRAQVFLGRENTEVGPFRRSLSIREISSSGGARLRSRDQS